MNVTVDANDLAQHFLNDGMPDFLNVMSQVLSFFPADDLIDAGSLHENADTELVMFNLGVIASAVAAKARTEKPNA